MTKIAENWKDYTLLDAGDGEKLESWNGVILRRPDPQAIWPKDNKNPLWRNADAHYHRSKSGGGSWEFKKRLPDSWTVDYGDLKFKVSPTGFKHTGLFPEQAVNWDWMSDLISAHKDENIRVLNLFAYTGGATMACSKAGAAEVVHVDSSKGMVNWAKENMELCELQDNTIRFMVDDCLKFVQREKRRGRTYHGIVMDPPSYGKGPNGERWKFEDEINELIKATMDILDEHALFFLINSYTTGFSSIALGNLLKMTIGKQHPEGTVTSGDIALPIESRELLLPCGIYGQWQRND